MSVEQQNDWVWKALADSTRREILDVLATGPKTTGQLVESFDSLCRTNVMKHLDVLVKANLVILKREGRVRWNYLNPVPIERVCNRWVSRHVKKSATALSRLKDHVETSDGAKKDSSSRKSKKTRSSKGKVNPSSGKARPSTS